MVFHFLVSFGLHGIRQVEVFVLRRMMRAPNIVSLSTIYGFHFTLLTWITHDEPIYGDETKKRKTLVKIQIDGHIRREFVYNNIVICRRFNLRKH
jgi:hypothetical protein